MKIVYKLLNFITYMDFLFIKGKFKNIGSNIKIGYLPTFSNPKYFSFGSNIIIGNRATLYAIDNDLFSKRQPKLTLGSNLYIGHNVTIHCMNEVCLGNNVVLSDYIYISDVSHGIKIIPNKSIMEQQWESPGKVVIGEGTFLGHGVKILPNVELGKNCIVASGSIVTKSFPDYCMLSGIPAKIIKKYCFIKNDWIKAND
jgi:acetyltransferase-like isoleucine patch superfamily enzyme